MKRKYVLLGLAIVAAIAIASPVFGLSSSLKRAIKKEVAKQISSAEGPQGLQGVAGGTGAQGPSALKLDFDQPETDTTIRTLGTLNELTVKARCLQDGGLDTVAQWKLNSSVAAVVNHTRSENTTTPTATVTNRETPLPAGVDTDVEGIDSDPGVSKRVNVVAIYRNANRVITFNLTLVANDGTGRCQLRGTAVPAS